MAQRRKYTEGELIRELDIERYALRKILIDIEPCENNDDSFVRFHMIDVVNAIFDTRIAKNPPKLKAKDAADIRQMEARADKLELQNAVQRAKYLEKTVVIVKGVQKAADLAKLLETVPMSIKRRLPDLPPKVVSVIDDELRKIQNRHVSPLQ